MFCENCGTKIESDSSYCQNCGQKVGIEPVKKSQENDHISSAGVNSICEICLQNKPTHYIDLYENVGALVVRYHKQIKGSLCFECQKFVFWKFTLKTLFLGWWGVISFIITPFILLNNIIRYSINYYKFKKV